MKAKTRISNLGNEAENNDMEGTAKTNVLAAIKVLVRAMTGNQDPTCDMVMDDIVGSNIAKKNIIKSGGGYANSGGAFEIQLDCRETEGGILLIDLDHFAKSKKYNVFSYKFIEFDEKDRNRVSSRGKNEFTNYLHFEDALKLFNDKIVTCYTNGHETFLEYSGFDENGKKFFLEDEAIEAEGKAPDMLAQLKKINMIAQNKSYELKMNKGLTPQ